MTLAEAIYQHSLNLSEVAAREALDFIQFLETRYAGQPNVVSDESKREEALKKLAQIRLRLDGKKPIENRDELYEAASSKTQ